MPPRLPAPPTGPAPRRSYLEEALARRGRSSTFGAGFEGPKPAPGTPEDVLRRATTAYTNKQAQAEALGVEGDGTGPTGFLEKIAGPLSILDKPRATVFGLATADPLNREHRGVGDLGPLQVKKDDNLLERSIKGALAFTGDVAMDPLTYVSFGVAPIGKKALSRVVSSQARQTAASLSDDAVRKWADDALRFKGTSRIRQLADEADDDVLRQVADQYDEVASTPPATWKGTQEEWTRNLGEQGFAGAATEAFQRGGAGELRQFLRTELGEEAGEAAFDALPLDLKGGPRLRVPFAKDERGLPKTLPLAGGEGTQGGGRLTEALFGDDGARALRKIHETRNQMRASRLGRLVADRFTGDPNGRLYGQMVADLYKQGDDGLDRVTWRAYEAVTEAGEAATATSRRLRNEAAMVLGRVEQMLEGAGDEAAQARARELFVERFNDPASSRAMAQAGTWDASTGEPIRFSGRATDPERVAAYEGMDDVERRAVSAAMDVQQHFEQQLATLRAAGMDVNEVRDYVARLMTEDEKLLRERRKPVRRSSQQGGKQAGTDPTSSRQRYVAGELVDGPDGDLHLELRWRTPEEINELEGRAVFETDPTQIVARYADAVSRATAKVQFANLVNEAGVTVPGGITVRRSVQEARVGRAGRAIEEQGRTAVEEADRVRQMLADDLAEARRVEADARGRAVAARQAADADDATAAAAERAARTAPGMLPEVEPGWVRLWRADPADADDGMVTVYRGMAEEFDPARASSAGTRFTTDLDYALNNTNGATHPLVYVTRIPRERLLTSEVGEAIGYQGPRGAMLDVDDVAGARLVGADDVRGRRFVADEAAAREAGGRLSYVDVPENMAASAVRDGGYVLPDDVASLRRPVPMGELDPTLARPRSQVVDEAGEEAVSAAEAELRRVAAEERLAEFERMQAELGTTADDRLRRQGAADFVFSTGDAHRDAVVRGLFAGDGEIELPNPALLEGEELADHDALTSALQAAGFEQVDIRPREATSVEEYWQAVDGVEETFLVDVWRPADDAALEDMRRAFVQQVDEHLPEDWQRVAFERFGRRLVADGQVRPSMTTTDVKRTFDPTSGASDPDAAFAATGITLDGPIEDVAVAVRFLEIADEAGFDVRIEDFRSPMLHTTDTALAGTVRQKGDDLLNISRGVQLEARTWAVVGAKEGQSLADARRAVARRFADAGVDDAAMGSLALRKAGKAERVTIARVQGRDLAAERAAYDEWHEARRAEFADDPMVEGEELTEAALRVRARREAEGKRVAKQAPNYRWGEQHTAPDYETWLEARHPEADGGRPTAPDEAGWPDSIEGLTDLYGRLRADGGRDAEKLAGKVEEALSDAGWRLEEAAGDVTPAASIPARGVGYAIFDADELYPHAGQRVEFVTGGRTEVRRLERMQKGGVRLVDPDGQKAPLTLEPEVADDATTLSVFDEDGVLELPVEGTAIRPLEGEAGPSTFRAVRDGEPSDVPESGLFSEGRTSPVTPGRPEAPRPVDDVTLDPDEARRLRNEARAQAREEYDAASRRALEEGRFLPDEVYADLNQNVVRSVEAGQRRAGRQAETLANRSRRKALRTRGRANAELARAEGRADSIESTLVKIDRQIDRVATDRDELLKVTRTILNDTPDVEQQQAAIGVLMEGLVEFHARTAELHGDLVRAANGQIEKRLAKARKAYSNRLAAEARRETGQAVRSQPIVDEGGDLLSEAGLQQIGQQKPLSGTPITEGLASLPPEIDVTWAPENTRLAIERFYQARTGDADVKRWIDGAYRPWFALFKAWATVGRGPGFHVRNALGIHFNNWIGGVTIADHSLSGTLVRARRQAVKEVHDAAAERMAGRLGIDVEEARRRVTPEVFEAEIDELLADRLGRVKVTDDLTLYDVHRMSIATGVGDATRVLEGLGDALGEQTARDFVAGRTRANLFPGRRADLNQVQRGVNRMVDNSWIRMSTGWGQLTEEYGRNAAFIQGLRRYGNVDGGRSAKLLSDGLHFDYQALTREEHFVKSTFIPFYVWMRRNVPLQFRGLFLTPGKYRALVAANEGARHAFEDDEHDVVPEWMRESLGWASIFQHGGNPIAVGVESPAIDINRMLKVPESLAPSDIADAAGATGRELISAMSPAVKAPIEQALGVDSFTGAEFNRNGVPAPWWYRALPDVVAPTRTDAQGQVRGSDARISALQDALPFLGLSDRAIPLTPQQRERTATNYLSLLAPVVRGSTLNPRQVAGELRSRTETLDEAIKWGPGADGALLAQVAELLEDGWTPEQIRQAIADGRL